MADGFPDSGIRAELLPAYSGGTVMDLHHLPRHPRRFSKTLFPEKLTVPLLHYSRAGDKTQAVLSFTPCSSASIRRAYRCESYMHGLHRIMLSGTLFCRQ